MAYTKQNFVDGQVLTAENMNNIVEGLSRNWVTSDEWIGSKDPVLVRLLPLNETETYLTGYATVKIASVADPITLEGESNGLLKLNISPIVYAFGDTIHQVIEAKYGVADFAVINPELSIYEISDIISGGIYSWDNVRSSSSINYYESDTITVFRMTVNTGYENIDQTKIDEICTASSSKFTFKFYVALS